MLLAKYCYLANAIGGLEVGSLIFLIVWERQPSFGVIVAIPAIFGLCYGLSATVALGKCRHLCVLSDHCNR